MIIKLIDTGMRIRAGVRDFDPPSEGPDSLGEELSPEEHDEVLAWQEAGCPPDAATKPIWHKPELVTIPAPVRRRTEFTPQKDFG